MEQITSFVRKQLEAALYFAYGVAEGGVFVLFGVDDSGSLDKNTPMIAAASSIEALLTDKVQSIIAGGDYPFTEGAFVSWVKGTDTITTAALPRLLKNKTHKAVLQHLKSGDLDALRATLAAADTPFVDLEYEGGWLRAKDATGRAVAWPSHWTLHSKAPQDILAAEMPQ
jgi:hypothetical protein